MKATLVMEGERETFGGFLVGSEVQTRRESGALNWHMTMKEALEWADRPTKRRQEHIWKVSFNDWTGRRRRFTRHENGDWEYNPIVLPTDLDIDIFPLDKLGQPLAWPDPKGGGFYIDAWNGWYANRDEALRESHDWTAKEDDRVLLYGQPMVSQDQVEASRLDSEYCAACETRHNPNLDCPDDDKKLDEEFEKLLDEGELISRCPACGSPMDYCQGHGEIGDPAGYAILQAHDAGDHSQCHPEGCDER